MDKSWMSTSRTKKQYINGVEAFIKFAVHNLQKMRNIDPRGDKQQLLIPCPCTTCLNHIEHEEEEVQFHLFKYGIDQSYTKWDKHGEKDEQATAAQIPVNATTEFVDDTDLNMEFGSQIPTDGPTTVEMVNATKDGFSAEDLDKFQELLLDAEKPLYKGCPDFTKLSAIVKLLNLKGKYGVCDKFFTELLGLVKKMLPAGNEMVEKTYQAKKIMRMMGSGYKKIHVCSNNCLLYWKDDKDLTARQTCGISKWKVDNKTHKVYENIPAKVMWITDGVLRHPADSQAWRTIDEKFPKIVEDPRNLRLGILADGVDVNIGNRHHSVWLALTVIYNLPPWLWVDTYDASIKDNFNLCAIVLWTINDYPVLGTLCGCPYIKFKGCVTISTIIKTILSEAKEGILLGTTRISPGPNPMTGEQIYNEVQHIENKWGKGKRTNNKALENQEDTRGKGGKVQRQKRNTTEEDGSSSQVNRQNGVYWKKFNIWYRKIRYWRHHSVPHCIDFMHVEKKVAESLVRTLLNVLGKMKDGVNALLDLAELGVKLELFAMQEEDKTTLPLAGHTLTNAEKTSFVKRYTTSGYHKAIVQISLVWRHKQVLKTKNPGKRIAFLENEHNKSFTKWLRKEVERELAISKESVSETIRWISYGPRATVVKYDAYNINGYTFRTKCHDGKVYQNSRVSVEAIDLHISKEVLRTPRITTPVLFLISFASLLFLGTSLGSPLESIEQRIADRSGYRGRNISSQMAYFVASSTLDSAISYVMQGASCTQRKVSMVSFGRISPNRFVSSILLVVVIIVTVVIVVVILVVVVFAIVGVVVVVVIFGVVVVVVDGVSSIFKLSFTIIGFELIH
ncbi:putative reverse transcriptase domain-containing protein [Tanacetum coccineum]|uniref:Reverse transcriptase domain-containing protein n=1 Tax=Tanacetum coccineum TaxID=301880 RepID=A0ABQ5B150_9ASTR